MIDLPNVTLVGVNGRNDYDSRRKVIDALLASSKYINFGEIVFLDCGSGWLADEIVHKKISQMTWPEYNDFMLFELTNHVNCDYAITVQADGFILNPNLWTDEFLQYDYIGAPWSYDLHLGPNAASYIGEDAYAWIHEGVKRKSRAETNLVGNGGFSLRSKKLLDETAEAPFDNSGGPEDGYICVNYFDYFVERGIKFAPLELAERFALQIDMYENPFAAAQHCFGFHGNSDILINWDGEK